MKIQMILLLTSMLFLSACGKKEESGTVAQPGSESRKSEVGPFVVEFSGPDLIYRHTFKADIDQSEGKVEYLIHTPESATVTFSETKLNVTGCQASAVTHNVFWIEDAQNERRGEVLRPGSQFRTLANKRGILMHSVHGLSGCRQVELTTGLKKTPPPPPPTCEGSSPGDDCLVKVFCKEKDPLSFYKEVEIWQKNSNLSLRQYMRQAGKGRSLMTMTDVNISSDSTTVKYDSTTSVGAQLKIATSNGIGIYSERIPSGGWINTNLECTLY